ncbi:MAG: MerR family transcriptional regulator [Gemmatimonadales bacterium]|jgi:methanogenic corrinoid protein MtbC1
MAIDKESVKRHPIRVVARRTGLTRDVLRAWEHRYSAIEPLRTPGGQRLYSDDDIDRLRLLRQAIEAGRRIGQLAELTSDELARLVQEDERASLDLVDAETASPPRGAPEHFLAQSLAACQEMNAFELDAILSRAAVSLEAMDLVDHVITPLMIEIGDLWHDGRLLPSQESMATGVVRRTLENVRRSLQGASGPALVVATPSGQHHEIGALLAATAAAADGWRVTFLGTDIPADSIAMAAGKTNALAVALSLTYPPVDPALPSELRTLRAALPDEIMLIVGGRSAAGYRAVLDEIGALSLPDAPALRSALDLVRTNRSNGNGKRSY